MPGFWSKGLPPASGSASKAPWNQACPAHKVESWTEILEKPVPNRDRFVNKCKICSADQLIAH